MYLQKRLIMTLCLNSWGNLEDKECIPLLWASKNFNLLKAVSIIW
jgi:hypothetical protein